MKKILWPRFASKLHLAASFLVIMNLLVASCGKDNPSYPSQPGGTTGGTTVVKKPVYQVACDSLASDVTVTTVVAQAEWSPTGQMVSEAFTPKNVKIPFNAVVKWYNNDLPGVTAPEGTWNGYNIYSEGWVITDPISSATSTVSAWIGPGQSFCVQFGTPGTYRYHCDQRTGAVGTVTVENP